jgi:hypothetical protein
VGGTLKGLLACIYATGTNAGNWLNDPDPGAGKLSRREHVDGLLMGHTPYGVFCSHLSEGTRVRHMREPVEHVLSFYYRHMHGKKFQGGVQLWLEPFRFRSSRERAPECLANFAIAAPMGAAA